MKITPIEIRQHTFQKVIRGYDTEEVSAFLTSLSNEWERVLNEHKMLKMQLEIAEKELNKLREVELTMFRMLKTAEDTSSQMTEQAKVAAETYIADARQKGEELVGEARKKCNMLVLDAENQAKYVREEIMGEFKNQERDLKAMEKYRDNLIVQLKTLANNTNDSIERFEKKFAQNSIKQKFDDLKEQVSTSIKQSEVTQKAESESEQTPEINTNTEENKPENIEDNDNQNVANAFVTTAVAADIQHILTDAEESIVESVQNVETDLPNEEPHKPEEDKTNEKGSFFDQV